MKQDSFSWIWIFPSFSLTVSLKSGMVVDRRNPEVVLVHILVNMWYTISMQYMLYFDLHHFRVYFNSSSCKLYESWFLLCHPKQMEEKQQLHWCIKVSSVGYIWQTLIQVIYTWFLFFFFIPSFLPLLPPPFFFVFFWYNLWGNFFALKSPFPILTGGLKTTSGKTGQHSSPKNCPTMPPNKRLHLSRAVKITAFTAHHSCHTLESLKLYLPLHRQKSYMSKISQRRTNPQQLNCYIFFLTCSSSSQNLIFLQVCFSVPFREKNDFAFTYLHCMVFVLNFRLKG